MYRLGNFCIFLILLPLLAALWVEGALFLSSLPNPKALLWFGVGMVGMFLLCTLLRGTALHFSEVATHEMTHALVGLPFWGEAAYINVEARDQITHSGGETTWILPTATSHPPFLMLIAPYSLPLLAVPPLILRLLPIGQTPPASLVIDAVLGAALAFHYVSIWDALRVQQSDFTTVGTIAGFAGAMTFQLLFLVVALSVVMGLPQLIGEYFWAALARARAYYAVAFGVLSQARATATG
jgi:hypothetical protein